MLAAAFATWLHTAAAGTLPVCFHPSGPTPAGNQICYYMITQIVAGWDGLLYLGGQPPPTGQLPLSA